MNEQEYIVVTNRIRVTSAKNAIGGCSVGDECGISKGQQRVLLDVLHTIEERLFKKTEAMMEYGEET